MSTAELEFRQATPDELPIVLAVLDEAAACLGRQNIRQWPPHFTGVKDWRGERIDAHVKAGHTWIVRRDGQVATFTIDDGADQDFAHGWPDGRGGALCIFRMAVPPRQRGRVHRNADVELASRRAQDEGKRWLQLDGHHRNLALQRYERHGFERGGTVITVINDDRQPHTRNSGALYQRAAGTNVTPTRTGRLTT